MLRYLFCNPDLSGLFSNPGKVGLFCTLYVIKSVDVTVASGISLNQFRLSCF